MKQNKLGKILILILLISIHLTSISYATVAESTTDENSEIPNILSDSVILINGKTGEIIYSKNGDQKMYPASTTKIMTAILVIENTSLTDIVTVSKSAISSIPSGYSTAYLAEGEQISVANLLKALLIHSANDAANVLAEYTSGSIEKFVYMMNEKATSLGCTNTHFVNANGIHNVEHFSTANDLSIIAKYCMENSTFRTLVSMQTCNISETNKSAKRTYTNTNDLILNTSEYFREDCIGIKTGYTSQAKNCLICASSKDDMELIAVILSAQTSNDRYSDANTLLDYGYTYIQAKTQYSQNHAEIIQNNSTTTINGSFSTSNFYIKYLLFKHIWIYLIKNDILLTMLRSVLILMVFTVLSMFLNKKKYNKN